MSKEKYVQAHKNAIAVQDACNLSGVLTSFYQDMCVVRDYLRDVLGNSDTDALRYHPVMVMYADKIHSMTMAKSFHSAYMKCAEVADGKVD